MHHVTLSAFVYLLLQTFTVLAPLLLFPLLYNFFVKFHMAEVHVRAPSALAPSVQATPAEVQTLPRSPHSLRQL